MFTKSFVVRFVNCLLAVILVGCTTVNDVYNVAGQFDKQTAQGMAIYKNKAFLANNTGICRIYDLRKDSVLGSFRFASAHKNNHSNCLDFGIEYPDGNKEYPALYISECLNLGRCFVEDINGMNPKLLQTISFIERVTNWVIDKENKKLYAIAHLLRSKKLTDSVSIYRFPLPSIHQGDIDLSDKVEEVFRVHVPYTLQGAAIHKGMLYLPVGINKGNRAIKKGERKVLQIDLKRQIIVSKIDLEDKITNEPEDVSVYRGDVLMFCGQSGGIFKIRVK